jgi:hypothetical protein
MEATGISRLNSKSLNNLSEHEINQSERTFSQKNYVSYLKSVKEPKISMGATRQNFQARPKVPQKSSKKSTNQNEHVPKKSMFSNLKV